jgi:hypothetical protein
MTGIRSSKVSSAQTHTHSHFQPCKRDTRQLSLSHFMRTSSVFVGSSAHKHLGVTTFHSTSGNKTTPKMCAKCSLTKFSPATCVLGTRKPSAKVATPCPRHNTRPRSSISTRTCSLLKSARAGSTRETPHLEQICRCKEWEGGCTQARMAGSAPRRMSALEARGAAFGKTATCCLLETAPSSPCAHALPRFHEISEHASNTIKCWTSALTGMCVCVCARALRRASSDTS